ncbi:Methyltransferase domain-containing protein [Humidesulfovibrio mexicanus]|uniref:Methyltransferase domain-containing protein n=1 Tax=Humidesulfovibrio mexicanus TaxID=147047 RepID=A0A238Y700_9BACT|nr:sulfotransferase [Humidesulfovibrio mexicanus]SNR66732.1 Methyltransferase domain-containing protein [Humidesulfovibrio mexicanus]
MSDRHKTSGLLSLPGAASPVLLVGCSRSGTTIMVRFLEALGLHMGVEQSGNRESRVFQNLNRSLLDMLGASWRCVEHLSTVEQLGEQHGSLVKQAVAALESHVLVEHFGPNTVELLARPALCWGWKDPRTSLLLPIWRRIFPQAKVIHMLRDGREVAQSLKLREDRRHKGRPWRSGEQECARFQADIEVWLDYVRRIGQALPLFPQSLTLRYESLLADPAAVLERLAGFLGLPFPRDAGAVAGLVEGFVPSSRRTSLSIAPWAWLDAEVDQELAYWDEGGRRAPEESTARGLPKAAARTMSAGDEHYTAYVGPPELYDVQGASQFRLLCALGLRSGHRLLDFGCGSLRAGRLLIPYLDPACYHGVEPNAWLVRDVQTRELGRDIFHLKQPRISTDADFGLEGIGGGFDYVLCQSVLSHCGPELALQVLGTLARALAPRGRMALTFKLASGKADTRPEGWVYPSCVLYNRAEVDAMFAQVGLKAAPLRWFHRSQVWFLAALDEELLPSEAQWEAAVFGGGLGVLQPLGRAGD